MENIFNYYSNRNTCKRSRRTRSVTKCYRRYKETNVYGRACLVEHHLSYDDFLYGRGSSTDGPSRRYRWTVNHTLDLLEPSPLVCRGVHLNRNDSRVSERWSRRKSEVRERERRDGKRTGRSDWRRNAKYHCPLYIQEHNLTKLLAHSDLLPLRGTGSFLIHMSDDFTLRPLVLLLLAPFNALDKPRRVRFSFRFPLFFSICFFFFLCSRTSLWYRYEFDLNRWEKLQTNTKNNDQEMKKLQNVFKLYLIATYV